MVLIESSLPQKGINEFLKWLQNIKSIDLFFLGGLCSTLYMKVRFTVQKLHICLLFKNNFKKFKKQEIKTIRNV